MFTRIAIDNFRAFTNFEYRPQRINLIVGPNGAGKTSFFDLLIAVAELTTGGEQIGHIFPHKSQTRWEKRRFTRVEFDIEGNDGRYTYELSVGQGEGERPQPIIDREIVKFGEKILFEYSKGHVHLHNNSGVLGTSFAARADRSFLAQIDDRRETKNLTWFLNFIRSVLPISLEPRSMSGTAPKEEERLARDGSNFASWYRHLLQEAPREIATLIESLAKFMPGLKTLKLPKSAAQARELFVVMNTGDLDYEVTFAELSDGQRALVVLYCLLAHPQEAPCLLLDEPAAYLSLPEIQPWLVELDDRYTDRGQVFIVSHHPEVIDYMASSSAARFERKKGGPVIVRPVPFENTSGLAASQQLSRSLLDAV